MELAEGSLKQWLPNGKLLLLSLTKCHGMPCSMPSRITTKVLKNYNNFSSSPRPDGSRLAGTRMSPFWILSELRMMELVTTEAIKACKAPVKSLLPTNQHPVSQLSDQHPGLKDYITGK